VHIRVDEFKIFARKGEFRIVFTFYCPEEEGKFDEVVVISIPPEGAKGLCRELGEEVKRYEKRWGRVKPWGEIPIKPSDKRYIA